MAEAEERGNKLMEEGRKKMESSKGFFSSMFGGGGSSKIEEASELYKSAGNSFKMAKKWSAAGNAFCEVAKIQEHHVQSKHEAATQYVEAAKCYRKADFQEAITCLRQAIEIFTSTGRFAIAAKHHVTIAEICESNLMDIHQAIIEYTQAADYYKGEESNSAANKCLLKVAMYSAQEENYKRAVDIYEEVATVSLESSLLKYSAREYFFKATLCQMCIDMVNIKAAIEKYSQMFPAFEDSRELKLLIHIIEAHEDESTDKFTVAVTEYNTITRLDQWHTTILLRIKKGISSGENDDLR